MSTAIKLRNAAKTNCDEICKILKQDKKLSEEKFKAILRSVEQDVGFEKIPFTAPEEFYRKVYNKSIEIMNSLKIRSQK